MYRKRTRLGNKLDLLATGSQLHGLERYRKRTGRGNKSDLDGLAKIELDLLALGLQFQSSGCRKRIANVQGEAISPTLQGEAISQH